MLVLLDRDGVINRDLPTGVRSQEEFEFLPGAVSAMVALTKAGHQMAVITNQSVVGKGEATIETVEAIHRSMCETVQQAGGRIDAIYACYDHPDVPTHRRKPAPGMIEEALRDFGAKAQQTPFVGDALRDLQAAYAAGCPRYLVQTGKGTQTAREGWDDALNPVILCMDIQAVVTELLQEVPQSAK